MAYTLHQQSELPPKAITYICIALGLLTMTYAIISQKLLIAATIIGLPLILIIFIYSVRTPRFSYLVYATIVYYFTAIMRYSRQEGLSVVLDVLLVYMFISILFCMSQRKAHIHIQNAVNCLTISYTAWMLFILLQFTHPAIDQEKVIIGIRSWILAVPMLYILSSLLADSPKILKRGLILIGIFTITAFLKLIYQKYWWFDSAETEWLMKGSWYTHILSTGIRYFSIFSDAGNFGASMGMITIVYSIVCFHTPSKNLRIFYLSVAIMGAIGMFMSGTRGAIIVPMGGLILYCFLSKNIKIMTISAISGVILYAFFAFTDIGDSNAFIRRMRTAFRPSDDASFNVRVDNQKLIGEYMATHPWGAGIDNGIPRTRIDNGRIIEENIPPDSFYVDIWIQTGSIGLILYITIYAIVLLRCCYIIMFRIKDKKLRHTLAALLCGVFGMWLNGYVGRGMGMPPNSFLIAASLAFVLNGPYIDSQLTDKKNFDK